MDRRTGTIDRRHSPLGQSRAPAAAGRLSPEPARAVGPPEAVADALATCSLGRLLGPGHVKGKRRAVVAEFRTQPPPGTTRKNTRFGAMSAIVSCCGLLTGTPCARDRTPDGMPGRVGAWWITPGGAACSDGPYVKGGSGDRWREVLELYPGWAQRTVEERA